LHPIDLIGHKKKKRKKDEPRVTGQNPGKLIQRQRQEEVHEKILGGDLKGKKNMITETKRLKEINNTEYFAPTVLETECVKKKRKCRSKEKRTRPKAGKGGRKKSKCKKKSELSKNGKGDGQPAERGCRLTGTQRDQTYHRKEQRQFRRKKKNKKINRYLIKTPHKGQKRGGPKAFRKTGIESLLNRGG